MKDSPYFKQAELMLKTIPHVAAETCFALKGGTAINLFVRDMPGLSVDIDLTYLPVDDSGRWCCGMGQVALVRNPPNPVNCSQFWPTFISELNDLD